MSFGGAQKLFLAIFGLFEESGFRCMEENRWNHCSKAVCRQKFLCWFTQGWRAVFIQGKTKMQFVNKIINRRAGHYRQFFHHRILLKNLWNDEGRFLNKLYLFSGSKFFHFCRKPSFQVQKLYFFAKSIFWHAFHSNLVTFTSFRRKTFHFQDKRIFSKKKSFLETVWGS